MNSAVKPKILVTRPQPGAEKTARQLSNLDMEPVILSFTEMVKIDQQRDMMLPPDADAVLVTSANALRHLDSRLVNQIKDRPVYAVGDSTRDAAVELGLSDVASANGGVKDLLETFSEELTDKSSIIYLCGQTRTDDVEQHLTSWDVDLTIVETYQTNKVSQLTYKLEELLRLHPLDGLLLYSGISARILSEVWPNRLDGKSTMIPTVFCISERAKMSLSPELQSRVIVCAQPRDDVMVDTVENYFRTKA